VETDACNFQHPPEAEARFFMASGSTPWFRHKKARSLACAQEPGFFGYIAEMIVGLVVEVSAIRLQRQRSVVKVSSGVVDRPWREHGQGRNQQC
jgi:hypothetical protein